MFCTLVQNFGKTPIYDGLKRQIYGCIIFFENMVYQSHERVLKKGKYMLPTTNRGEGELPTKTYSPNCHINSLGSGKVKAVPRTSLAVW
jgi:hypothetical protein